MTPKQADKLIRTGALTTFQDKYGDTFQGRAVSRDRHTIKIAMYYTSINEWRGNGVFDRSDLAVVS